jgi:uncharacterized membrane protein
MNAPDHSVHIKSIELERLIFYSDAIFAIAITLLVLELRVPDELTGSDPTAALVAALAHMAPKFVSYVTSFAIIGLYWFVHHRLFRHIRRWDDGLIVRNLFFLFWVAFLPFPVALLGRFGGLRLAVVLYAATLFMLGVGQLGIWLHASRGHRLIDPGMSPDLVRFTTWRSAVPPLVALIVIALAFVLPIPPLANMAYGLIFLGMAMLRRRYQHVLEPAVALTAPKTIPRA